MLGSKLIHVSKSGHWWYGNIDYLIISTLLILAGSTESIAVSSASQHSPEKQEYISTRLDI